jgi:hypothetical protein
MHTLQTLKHITLKDGLASGDGFLLGGSLPDAPGMAARLDLSLADATPFVLLFGWVGIGSHFRLQIDAPNRVLAIYQIRDGIPLYLHHVCLDLPRGTELSLQVEPQSLRVRVNGFCVMNLLADLPAQGRWGFAPLRGTFRPPDVSAATQAPAPVKWLCLGDGFSNNRWRNRHFLSWPELLFGRSNECLNACVAAANSCRVLAIASTLGTLPAGATALVATGSDDLIEGESCDAFTHRLGLLVERLRGAGVKHTWLATLPPLASAPDACRTWSERIRRIAEETGCGLLDFHDWLAPRAATCMVHGGYPGKDGQALLAARVAVALQLDLPHDAPATTNPPRAPGGRLACLARKIVRRLEPCTGDFPGMLR